MRARIVAMCLATGVIMPSYAALENGSTAPRFETQASLAGKSFRFSLEQALKRGPVVLYFYPAAFTTGCTIEAHMFAEAADDFETLGATVIGVSPDDIETLNKFSVSECRSKFAVAPDANRAIIKDYDAVWAERPQYANRTTYVIAQDGRIVHSFTDLRPDKHVQNALATLRQLKSAQ